MTMQRLFAAALAVACVVASTPSFARGGFAHGAGRGGFVRDPTVQFGTGAAQTPAFESRAPAPLPAPTQAPVINGPMSQPAFRGLTGIGQ
jgi:hypothetical protein